MRSVTPTERATKLYNEQVKAALPQTSWLSGCKGWYLGKDGMPELFPWHPDRHTELLRYPVVADFDVEHGGTGLFAEYLRAVVGRGQLHHLSQKLAHPADVDRAARELITHQDREVARPVGRPHPSE